MYQKLLEGALLVRHVAGTGEGIECEPGLCETGLPRISADSDKVGIIVQMILAVMGLIALIYIIIAGYKMVISLGNPEALGKLRQSIIFAAIGLAIILSAEVIIGLVLRRI